MLAVVTAAVPGVLLGLIAAWAGGWTERLLSAISDAFLALPGLLLVLIVTAFAPGVFGPLYLGLALALWVEYFRTTRAAARQRLMLPDVEAARLLGFGPAYILRYHIWPELIAPLTTLFGFGVATVVLAVSALSFVGIGLRPPVAEWGSMMTELLPYYDEAPVQLLLPAGLLFLTVLALLLLTGRKAP
ncbi:ABC transporter permease [Elstera litoralis]|uniref:ABC transporter permease n=1 Tax=Elstera litoralis TaxID=552518 RepID=UPI000ABF0CCB|nr:ABC transporter permease subunit [Elstera litoralis]